MHDMHNHARSSGSGVGRELLQARGDRGRCAAAALGGVAANVCRREPQAPKFGAGPGLIQRAYRYSWAAYFCR